MRGILQAGRMIRCAVLVFFCLQLLCRDGVCAPLSCGAAKPTLVIANRHGLDCLSHYRCVDLSYLPSIHGFVNEHTELVKTVIHQSRRNSIVWGEFSDFFSPFFCCFLLDFFVIVFFSLPVPASSVTLRSATIVSIWQRLCSSVCSPSPFLFLFFVSCAFFMFFFVHKWKSEASSSLRTPVQALMFLPLDGTAGEFAYERGPHLLVNTSIWDGWWVQNDFAKGVAGCVLHTPSSKSVTGNEKIIESLHQHSMTIRVTVVLDRDVYLDFFPLYLKGVTHRHYHSSVSFKAVPVFTVWSHTADVWCSYQM